MDWLQEYLVRKYLAHIRRAVRADLELEKGHIRAMGMAQESLLLWSAFEWEEFRIFFYKSQQHGKVEQLAVCIFFIQDNRLVPWFDPSQDLSAMHPLILLPHGIGRGAGKKVEHAG